MTADNLLGLLTLAALIFAYFVPAIVAGVQGKRTTAAIFFLNFFLGWTGIFWVIALVWAFVPDAPHQRAQGPDLLLVPTHWAANDN